MAFRFGRQPLQFNFEQEPMQGVTYQTPDVLPGRTPSAITPFASTALKSPQTRRFDYETEQLEEEENKDPEFNFGDMFKKRPTFDATQRYIDALEKRPTLDTYKPNMAQNIFGAIAGVGAGLRGAPGKDIYGSVERIRYGPYQRALQDWEGQMEGLGSGAEAEQKKAEVDTRWMTSMGNLYNQKSLAENRIDASNRGWANIDVKREKQQADIQKAIDAGWKVVKGVDGRVIATNPRDPNAQSVDLGVDTGAELAGERNDITRAHNAETERQGRGRVAQGWAGVSQRGRALDQTDRRLDQADTSIAQRGANIESLIVDRAFKQAASETETQLTPADKKTISELALQETFVNNPRFRALVDETGNFYEDAEDDPLYPQFQQYFNSRVAEHTKPKTSTTGRRRPTTTGSVVTPITSVPNVNMGTAGGVIDFNNLPR